MKLADFFSPKVTLRRTLIPRHVGLFFRDDAGAPVAKTKCLMRLLHAATKLNIPILSIYALPAHTNPQRISHKIDDLVDLVHTLLGWQFIYQARVKVTILGHWYDLPARLVDPLKKIQESTRQHDAFFLNLCINYDGQAEIVDAASIIARQVKLGKLDPEKVTKESVKEALSTSYFVHPDLIIKSGPYVSLRGFLLWDSAHSIIFFTKKGNLEFTPQDLLRAVSYYQQTISPRQTKIASPSNI